MFRAGEYALESLERAAQDYDGAVVIATKDDRLIARGDIHSVPRDNLILEYGMFVATFGRHRAILMVETPAETHLPSDTLGLTVLPFKLTTPTSVGIAPSINRLRELATSWRDRPIDPDIARQLEGILRVSVSSVLADSGVGSELGMHVFLVDQRRVPGELIRVARARSNPKPPVPWSPFEEGHGVVGVCWHTCREVFVDLTSEPFASATRDSWEATAEVDRFGMDFEMLRQSRERYQAVGAVPVTTIRDGGSFLGCVSYNLGTASSGASGDLQKPLVRRDLDVCGELVALVLGR